MAQHKFRWNYPCGHEKVHHPPTHDLEYFLTDHLGSTSITLDSNGAKVSEMRYKAWGELRYTWTATQTTTPGYKLPMYTYTGQASYLMDDPYISGVTEGFGLMFYCVASLWDNARWYDPALSIFAQADIIVPAGVQGLDRYAYFNNNPMRYTDPSGHGAECGPDGMYCDKGGNLFKPSFVYSSQLTKTNAI